MRKTPAQRRARARARARALARACARAGASRASLPLSLSPSLARDGGGEEGLAAYLDLAAVGMETRMAAMVVAGGEGGSLRRALCGAAHAASSEVRAGGRAAPAGARNINAKSPRNCAREIAPNAGGAKARAPAARPEKLARNPRPAENSRAAGAARRETNSCGRGQIEKAVM